MNVIAIANQKGGVGKTVTAVTLAHGAALNGLRICLVDLDPQGNVADSLGLDTGNDLVAWLDGSQIHWKVEGRQGLDVIRADKHLVAFKSVLAGRDYREYVVSEAAERVKERYDLMILDCAPSMDVLHVAALVAADWLIIPTRLDQFSLKGVAEILKTLESTRRRGGRCALAGVLPTFFDRVTVESQKQLENLAAGFKGMVWPMIPQDARVRPANRAGKTLWEYAPGCRALVGLAGIGGGYQSVLSRMMDIV